MESPAVSTGTVSFRGYKTWYTLFGTVSATGPVPLVAMHGGPSAGHDYLLPFGALHSICGIPVLLYDQIGCGKSSHLRDAPPSMISIDFFVDELQNLLASLRIGQYDLIGHSIGAVLACEVAARQPEGLRKLIIYSGMASLPLGEQVRYRCYEQLGPKALNAILQHEKDGKATTEYEEAMSRFRKTNMCRTEPPPEDFLASVANMRADRTVSRAMLGDSDIHTTGVLGGWSIIDRRHLINNKVLVITGQYDYCGDEALEPFLDGTMNAHLVRFVGASHMAHFDKREEFTVTLVKFLQT